MAKRTFGTVEAYNLKDFTDTMNKDIMGLPFLKLEQFSVTRDGNTYSYTQTFTYEEPS